MRTFPVMLKLTGRQSVVVGSGPIALRKARSLLDAGAHVRLVSPTPPSEPLESAELILESYQPAHLTKSDIVFACTNNHALNAQIANDARRAGAWVCAVDQPDDCDFFSPAVVRDGDVIVAVGTGGAAPGLAKSLAKRVGSAVPERIGDFAACLAELRREMQTTIPDSHQRHALFRALIVEDVYQDFLVRGAIAIRERLNALMPQGGSSCDSSA